MEGEEGFSYSFVQVDGVFARDYVGDGGTAGGGFLGRGGLGFSLLGRHRDLGGLC